MASIVREAISAYLTRQDGKTLKREEIENAPFFEVVGIGESGIQDNSSAHDLIYRTRLYDLNRGGRWGGNR
ncbi:MAG TPA: hypothetical protein GXX51_03350 [Firmicutes bacterium]|nr:hypothetical protein [Bacillota bacterium]